MHKGQTHIKRKCFSIGIISSNLQSGCYTSVHTGRTRDRTPAAPDRLDNEHHRRDHRARLEEKVRRGYHPKHGGRYDTEEDRSPSPEPPGPRVFSRAIRRASFPTRFRAPTTITMYSGETRPELWLADYWLAC
jgi:hypothetical protein